MVSVRSKHPDLLGIPVFVTHSAVAHAGSAVETLLDLGSPRLPRLRSPVDRSPRQRSPVGWAS